MTAAALVLAGTRPEGDPLAGAEGKAHKALIEIAGRPLLQRVIEALRDGGMGRIVVSCDEGPVAELARRCGAETLPTAAGPSGSVLKAFDYLGTPLLVTTADHALLEGKWAAQMVADTPDGADLSIMFAERADIERSMPGSKRTYLKFRDGAWSGCNLFYLRTPRARAAIEAWQAIEADRKRPWRIAARLGLGTLLTYAAGRLTLAGGIETLGRRMGLEARLVRARDGLAAVDVDKPQDLTDIRALLESR